MDWTDLGQEMTLLPIQSSYALVRPYLDYRLGGLISIDHLDRPKFYIVLGTYKAVTDALDEFFDIGKRLGQASTTAEFRAQTTPETMSFGLLGIDLPKSV